MARATVVGIEVEQDDGILTATAVGPHSEKATGRVVPKTQATIFNAVNTTGTALLIEDGAGDERVAGSALLADVPVGPVLAIPMPNTLAPKGAVIIGRSPGAEPFSPTEIDLAKDFTAHAALAPRFAQQHGVA